MYMSDEENRPHGRNLRKGRCSEPGQVYLLTLVTWQRFPVFADLSAARLVVQAMRCHQQRDEIESLAYVLMPDHLHWLIQLRQGSLARLMQRFKGYSSVSVNRTRMYSGRLWQQGYHDHALRQEEELRETARYIIANPLRAGLVERVGDYPHWDAVWL
jgi:putative transposase